MFKNIYQGKRALVTGHTGFKGSRLCIWLKELGAAVVGYALDPRSEPNNFSACRLKEKSILHEGWINCGFFVIKSEALNYIKEDVMWEHAPMEKLAEDGELYAYKHEGFWQCMDTARDLRYLESIWETGSAPWKIW